MTAAPDKSNEAQSAPPLAVCSSAGLVVGGRVRLVKSIFDDGEDHHPPGWLALAGEILNIKGVRESGALSVAHDGVNDSAFLIYPGEFETPNSTACAVPASSKPVSIKCLTEITHA